MDQSQPQVETPDQSLHTAPNGTLPQPGDTLPAEGQQTSAQRWDGKHFINVRLSIPLLFMRVYVTLVAGKERRDKTRRRAERKKHPLGTLGNSFFFSTTSALISLSLLAVIIVATVVVIRQLFSVEITVR
jgi:hypothetical protein